MHGETQANRLAALMYKKGNFTNYELALPLVTVESYDLANLAVDDVFLLGVKYLECILLQEGALRARVILSIVNGRHYLKIEKNYHKSLTYESNEKYVKVLFSLGTLKSRTLDVGHLIELSQLELYNVTVTKKDKKIGQGTLVNVEGELAVQINKVERYE